MSDKHKHPEKPVAGQGGTPPVSPPPAPPETPLDAGSQALSEALRSSFSIVKIVMVVLVLLFLGSGFFTVDPQEQAIKLRFGKVVGEGERALLGPGPHWAFPYPIDEVVKVPITESLSVRSTVGWYAVTPEQEVAGTEPFAGPSLNPTVDGYVITSDLNVIHARATAFYRIEDPIGCIFGFAAGPNGGLDLAGTSNAVLNALNTALVQTSGQFAVDDILRREKVAFKEALLRRTSELLRERQVGVVVDQVEQVEGIPPRQLKADFARVTDALLKRDRLINEARRAENQVTNSATAQAAALINIAQSDRARLEESIKAEASRFNELLPRYRENPALFVQLQLSETLSRVLTNVQDLIYLPHRADGDDRELRLLLNRLPEMRRAAPTSQE